MSYHEKLNANVIFHNKLFCKTVNPLLSELVQDKINLTEDIRTVEDDSEIVLSLNNFSNIVNNLKNAIYSNSRPLVGNFKDPTLTL